jgi:hypothetical protein
VSTKDPAEDVVEILAAALELPADPSACEDWHLHVGCGDWPLQPQLQLPCVGEDVTCPQLQGSWLFVVLSLLSQLSGLVAVVTVEAPDGDTYCPCPQTVDALNNNPHAATTAE